MHYNIYEFRKHSTNFFIKTQLIKFQLTNCEKSDDWLLLKIKIWIQITCFLLLGC